MNFHLVSKVELHLHLDCSMSYGCVKRLAPGTSQEEYRRDYIAPMPCANLKEFLDRSARGVALLQTEDALRLSVEDLFEQLAADGVIYAEIRFAPLLHLQKGLTPERVVEVIERTTASMNRTAGVEARLILCTLRHFSEQQSLQTAKLVHAFRRSTVAGFDIAGDEAGFPLDAHLLAFRFAHEHGISITAHAGEASGPKSVWDALEHLKPSRIGHGIRSIEDAELVAYLRDCGVHLEICPSSNVQIVESIGRWQDHPIDKLYRTGVPLNVNTDCRMLTDTTLAAEYAQMDKYFAWTEEDFRQTNLAAIRAGFCDEQTKARLEQQLKPQALSAPSN
jgi:adenosine deaminase